MLSTVFLIIIILIIEEKIKNGSLLTSSNFCFWSEHDLFIILKYACIHTFIEYHSFDHLLSSSPKIARRYYRRDLVYNLVKWGRSVVIIGLPFYCCLSLQIGPSRNMWDTFRHCSQHLKSKYKTIIFKSIKLLSTLISRISHQRGEFPPYKSHYNNIYNI